jgi:uncharacterized protein (UPF0332 family)
MSKASRALTSARLLLDAGDVDGACNRAYYAMFDAAQAALMASGASAGSVIKTHSGLISAFSLHFVKSARLPFELGRSLNRVAEIRLVADYTGEEVSMDKAQWAIEQAAAFVDAIQRELAPQDR